MELKQSLSTQFELKDLGLLSYFLRLEVSFDSACYYLSQAKYAIVLLSRASWIDNKTANTPLEANVKLSPTE